MTETTILDERAVSEIKAKTLTGHYPDLDQVRALCDTVKYLRERLTTMREAFSVSSTDRERELQSQLEQLRAERDRAGAHVTRLHDELVELQQFRTRVIQLCKNKAEKYKALADDSLPNDQTAARTAAMATALKAFAVELEKL